MKHKKSKKPYSSFLEAYAESVRLEVNYENHLQSWGYSKYDSLGVYVFKFNYITDGYKSYCELPLSEPMYKINFTPELKHKPQNVLYNYLVKAMQHPLVVSALTGLSVVNVAAGVGYGAAALAPLHVVGLTMSVLYLSGAVLAYLVVPAIRKKLIAKFDAIELEVKQENYKDYERVENISLIYKIILHKYFPGNNDLKYRYYYLNALSHERWGGGFRPIESPYNAALEYCETLDQKFNCLRGVINSADLWCDGVKIKVNYHELAEPYVVQISSDSKQYQELGSELRKKVYDCINTLLGGNALGAIHEFYKIEFDAYSKKAYPDITVLYLQLDAILVLIAKDHKSQLTNFDSDCMRLGDAFRLLKKVSEQYICKFYPEKIPLYSKFILNFYNFRDELPTEYKPKPGKKPITPANHYFSMVEMESDDETASEVRTPKTPIKPKM